MKKIVQPLSLVMLVLLVCIIPAKTQEISSKEKEIIYTEAYNLIENYETTINKIADNINTNEAAVTGLKDNFIRLFLNRQIQVYNDLEPGHQYSEFYEAETYISNLTLWYPDGMRISFDYNKIQTPGIKPHKDNIWFMDIIAEKKINGNYMNRTLNENKEELSFRIAFLKKDNKLSNFKIVGIRNIRSNTVPIDNKALQEMSKTEYTAEELINVHEATKSLLLDYSRSLELIGNPEESKENKEYFSQDFLSLFEAEFVRVFNDLELKPQEELIDVKSYLDKYKTDYPEGISNLTLNTDSATFSHIEATEDGKYETFVYIEKFFTGNFRDKQKITQSTPLIFTISVEKKDNVFQNFRIKSIDREYTDFSGINSITTGEEQLQPVKPIGRTGSSLGICAMGGLTLIGNKNLKELTISADNHEWNTTIDFGYSAGFDYFMAKNEKYAVRSGFRYSTFKTTYSLDGTFVANDYQYDPNAHRYIDSVNATFDSTLALTYLGVPIALRYYRDINKKVSLFADIGINLSFLYKADCELNGRYDNYGHIYEPDIEPPFTVLGEEELGFRNDYYNAVHEKATGNSTLNISGEMALGVIIKTGYFSSFQFGPKILFGINSIYSPGTYFDIFDQPHETKSTRTNNFGFEISYIRKL